MNHGLEPHPGLQRVETPFPRVPREQRCTDGPSALGCGPRARARPEKTHARSEEYISEWDSALRPPSSLLPPSASVGCLCPRTKPPPSAPTLRWVLLFRDFLNLFLDTDTPVGHTVRGSYLCDTSSVSWSSTADANVRARARVGRVDKVRNKDYAKIVFKRKVKFLYILFSVSLSLFCFYRLSQSLEERNQNCEDCQNGESFFTTQIFTLSTWGNFFSHG